MAASEAAAGLPLHIMHQGDEFHLHNKLLLTKLPTINRLRHKVQWAPVAVLSGKLGVSHAPLTLLPGLHFALHSQVLAVAVAATLLLLFGAWAAATLGESQFH